MINNKKNYILKKILNHIIYLIMLIIQKLLLYLIQFLNCTKYKNA